MINVDISNVWGEISLPDLLAAEADIAEAHRMLMDGTGAGGGCRGWLEQIPQEQLRQIQDAARELRENSEILVVLGLNGACTGARGAIELLQGSSRNLGRGKGDPQILFAGNSFSTRQWNGLMKLLEGKDFSVCAVSGSGESPEVFAPLRNLRWILERRYGTDGALRRIVAVTGTEGPLRAMAEDAGWTCLTMPENADGGFSVLSAAGLLPMAAAGIDIEAVLQGAREAKEEYDLRSFENPVWLYAAVRNLMFRGGRTGELLVCNEPDFRSLGNWWQQLFAGAEGKDGKGMFPLYGLLTGDLYTLGQLVQQGRQSILETVLFFRAPEQKMIIGEDVRNLDGLNYLAGRGLDQVEEIAIETAMAAHGDGGVPVVLMECAGLDGQMLGRLIWFFQLSCSISAYVLGVNPFSRPGAAQYKADLLRTLGKPDNL